MVWIVWFLLTNISRAANIGMKQLTIWPQMTIDLGMCSDLWYHYHIKAPMLHPFPKLSCKWTPNSSQVPFYIFSLFTTNKTKIPKTQNKIPKYSIIFLFSIICITWSTWLILIHLMHNTKTTIYQIYDPSLFGYVCAGVPCQGGGVQ